MRGGEGEAGQAQQVNAKLLFSSISSDDLSLHQRQVVNKSNNKKEEEKAPEPALTKRGTKVPYYAEKDEDSFSSTKKPKDPQLVMAKLKN